MQSVVDPDGSVLLTTPQAHDLLTAAVEHAGGSLVSWRLDHVDISPRHSTTATYAAVVDWPDGRRDELLGASARVGGRSGNDDRTTVFGDGEREVAVWLYPDDPDLPGLRRATTPDLLAEVLAEYGVLGTPATAPTGPLAIEMISYRPRRRAVLKATVPTANGPLVLFVKVLREAAFGATLQRHQLLVGAGVAAPVVLAATPDDILVLRRMAGRPLAQAIFDEAMPCSAENMITLLDSMPPAVCALTRRPPWSDAVGAYAEMISAAMPEARPRLDWLAATISAGLAGIPPGNEPTHGDFHEGQIFVAGGVITGLGDIDTVGPGRRADDLACMIAHLSTVQRMSAEQAAGLTRLISLWMRVFDLRVEPHELRLRAAGVIISLATGPYRGQEPGWRAETLTMISAAEALIRSSAG